MLTKWWPYCDVEGLFTKWWPYGGVEGELTKWLPYRGVEGVVDWLNGYRGGLIGGSIGGNQPLTTIHVTGRGTATLRN